MEFTQGAPFDRFGLSVGRNRTLRPLGKIVGFDRIPKFSGIIGINRGHKTGQLAAHRI